MKKITLFLLLTLSFSINAQFTEGFESGIPDDWTVINNGGANGWVQNTSPVDGALEGTAVASITYNSSAHDDYLITPAIAVSVGVNESLAFNVKSRSSAYLEAYEVLLSTTDTSEAAFSVVLQASSDAPNAWTKILFDLSAYDGQTVYVAVRATDTDRFALYVDDVYSGIEVAVPECATTPSPAIAATDVQINTATASVNIGWEAPASGPAPTGYEVFWGETSGSLTSIGSTTDTAVSITNVNYNTTYYWMVVPSNAGGSAEGCAEWSFTTDPMANIDYLNPFTTFPGAGWAEAAGPINEPAGTSSAFVQDDFGNDTTHENGKSARINIYGTSVDEYLITPKFDLSGGTYYLNADLALTLYGNSMASALDPDDYLVLLVTQDDGATWTELARWDETSTLTPEGAPMDEIMLSGYNNDTYFAFYAFSDTSGVDNDLFIDNFQITAASLAPVTDPTEAAPTPPARAAADVVSLFSDAYTDVTLTELPTDWSDVTTFEATTVASDNVWKLSGLEFLGMVTNYDTGIDVSSMEKLHIDYWVPTGVENELLVKIVNTIDGGEDVESLGTTVAGSWQSIDLDMTGFDGGNLANTEKITQILIDAVDRAATVYVDNFYFYKEPVVVTEPTEAAPTPPARETADVVSLFSDAYTDVTLTELPTDWSDVTTFEATTVASDNVWKLSGLEFLGMVTNYDTGIDVSSMEKLHIDYWVPTGVENELLVKIVNTIDGGEDVESLGTTVAGSWQSIDLDMTGFDGGNLANTEKITQILIDAVDRAATVYVDNFYFYKEPSTTSDIIFITELADPNDNAAARYVEIYNGGTSDVDLTGWTLRRYTNGNAEPQTTGEDLSPIGSLAPGAIAIIAANGTAFEAAFGMAADISAGSGGPADSNGDDQIYITDASDTIVDFFGVPGEDGSGTDHEFEDGRAERKASVTQGTATWDVNEWNIDNDAGAGDGALNVDGGFDPGVWIGADTAGVENESLVTLNMYPNPAIDVLNISAQSTINTVEIFNVLGQKVITIQVEDTSAEINVSNLNAGIYLIKYEINNSTSTKKFVKN